MEKIGELITFDGVKKTREDFVIYKVNNNMHVFGDNYGDWSSN